MLYDRPPVQFRRMDINERSSFFDSHQQDAQSPLRPLFSWWGTLQGSSSASLYPVSQDKPRPLFALSSTSWTEDEDFSLLFTTLERYCKEAASKRLPPLAMIITGSGPMKQQYLDRWNRFISTQPSPARVCVCTPWLTAEDYPRIIGCCDFGVSLHQSSSGLDLPMKVVDMFGCALPVLARNYSWSVFHLNLKNFHTVTFFVKLQSQRTREG